MKPNLVQIPCGKTTIEATYDPVRNEYIATSKSAPLFRTRAKDPDLASRRLIELVPLLATIEPGYVAEWRFKKHKKPSA